MYHIADFMKFIKFSSVFFLSQEMQKIGFLQGCDFMLYISCTFNDYSLKITIIRLIHIFSNQRHVIYHLNTKSLILSFKIFFVFLIYKMTSVNIALALCFSLFDTWLKMSDWSWFKVSVTQVTEFLSVKIALFLNQVNQKKISVKGYKVLEDSGGCTWWQQFKTGMGKVVWAWHVYRDDTLLAYSFCLFLLTNPFIWLSGVEVCWIYFGFSKWNTEVTHM